MSRTNRQQPSQPARRATPQPAYNIFDHPAVQRVTAWALLWQSSYYNAAGDFVPCSDNPVAGRILIAYPSDGAGIVRAYVEIHAGPLAISWGRPLTGPHWEAGATLTTHSTQGTAGGGGYCKASAAVADACDRLRSGAAYDALSPLYGRGMSAVRSALETSGYQVVEVL